jgi:threonine aldolase
MKYSFRNDYSEIAHPKVIQRLMEYSSEQNIGYAEDKHTLNAINIIRKKSGVNCDVHFLLGGTQANMVVISSSLRPYEAVICAETGHINVHETGAIEGQGHKCLACKCNDGKLTPNEIQKVLDTHVDCHMVKPKMVYISNPTELGTVYNKEELTTLYKYCKDNNLYLFLDGARLASALAATNLTFADLGKYTDVYYIGGTKCGAPFGEAVVINNNELKKEFRYSVKHYGAMYSKGFIQGIIFEALLEDDTYINIGKHQNAMAKYLIEEIAKLGIPFKCQSKTNQIFPIVSYEIESYIKKEYDFEVWEANNNKSNVIRLVTSFNTTQQNCIDFIEYLRNFRR